MEKKVIVGLSLLLTFLVLIIMVALFDTNKFDSESCLDTCLSKGYVNGSCMWHVEAKENQESIGECIIPLSKNCGISEVCGCYCEKGENYKECETDYDCVVYGKTGDCGTGCYAKDKVPKEFPTEKCFSLAPEGCVCNNGRCEDMN